MVAALRLGTFNGDGSFVQFTASLCPEDRRILLVALLLPGPSLEDRPERRAAGTRRDLQVQDDHWLRRHWHWLWHGGLRLPVHMAVVVSSISH